MKDKLLSFFRLFDISIIAFTALTTRIVLYGATLGDSLAISALAGVYGYHKYLHRKNEVSNMGILKDIDNLKKDIESVSHRINSRTLYEPRQKTNVRKF